MSELLLELYTEEIPAMMQKPAEKAFEEIYAKALKDVSISYDIVKAYISPRRIAIYIDGLPKNIESQNIEIKGPKISAPDNAIDGFCRSNNISRNDLVEKNSCYFYQKTTEAKDIKDILPDIISSNIGKYVWPKSMYWGNYKIKWVRPLLNILCILDGDILSLKYGHLESNNKSFGHRFADYSSFEVTSFEDYRDKLLSKFVVLDRVERLEKITSSIKELEKKYNIEAFDEPKLLEEVAGLNEHINVLVGKISPKFMHLPPEVLVSSMKSHQKFFPCKDSKGEFAPYFIFVSNVPNAEDKEIIHGNEKVLSARLSDALYFYSQDQKTLLKDRDLSTTIFHANIGTMRDKVNRMVNLAKYLDKENNSLVEAISLCKADLMCEIVGEFPELQGIMGCYYSQIEGYSKEVSLAIKDHYKPMGGDDIPKGLAAKLSFIDKMDSLIGLMIAGERATGSKDPFALRRMALGAIRIIIFNEMEINIKSFIDEAYKQFNTEKDIKAEIVSFIEERLKNHYKDIYPIQVIKASVDINQEDNILVTDSKIRALDEFAKSESGGELIEIYRRVNNILSDSDIQCSIDVSMFESEYEKNLYNSILKAIPIINNAIESSSFADAYAQALLLKVPLSEFFDNVMVNHKDLKIAQNRRAILVALSDLLKQIAHFEYL